MTNTVGALMVPGSAKEGLANVNHISACQGYIRNLAMEMAGG